MVKGQHQLYRAGVLYLLDRDTGQPLATVKGVMTTQDGEVMATGQAEILLPSP